MGRNPGTHVLSKVSAVLFDLDDTLLNTFGARLKALQQVFRNSGIYSPTAEEFLRSLNGREMTSALGLLQRNLQTGSNLFEHYRRAYWGKAPGQVSAYAGVKSMLHELHVRNIKLGVVTQKRRSFEMEGRQVGAQEEMAEARIADMFSAVIGFEDASNHKPHPEGVNLALHRVGVAPETAIMVGDSAADIAAGRAAGCWTCYATWGVPASVQAQASLDADFIADTPQVIGLWTKTSS
ncbi:MAG: HAD family hydrolase [Dehalococcoidia bacterium]|nr:HAD family hydrolase [Dehalococcoidia bacterium]